MTLDCVRPTIQCHTDHSL